MLAHPYFHYASDEPTCLSNHNLIKTDDLCQLYAFRSFPLNTYTCQTCQNVFFAEVTASYHCIICKFNLCADCYQIEKIRIQNCIRRARPQKKKNEKPIEVPQNVQSGSENIDKMLCVLCLAEERNYVFSPCMHLCCCEKCCNVIVQKQSDCPICRNKIKSSFKIYYA